ncbi:MAG: hypothetical protein AAGA81_19070 [Acidobacteriota bacterium]
MEKATFGARILLGIIFTVFGLNGFVQFIPVPEAAPAMGEFMGALMATGYMMPWVKATEVICGVLLLAGRFVPLALTILAPITLNILAIHLFLDGPASLPIPIVLVVLSLLAAWGVKDAYSGLLRATPE